jgi:predicted nucleic acid-binding Zn ribbon protein
MCNNCHNQFQRKWTAPPVTFRGTGFYSTDHSK